MECLAQKTYNAAILRYRSARLKGIPTVGREKRHAKDAKLRTIVTKKSSTP
jgi:hypothetical protein